MPKDSPMKIKQLFLILFLFIVPPLPVIADSIGFSFNSDRDNTAMDETTVAGIVPSSGWVSIDGGADAQGGANGSISNSGVKVDWSSNGTWNTNNGVSNGDNQLMNGYIDAIGSGGSAQIIINDINNAFTGSYDIYVYFGSDGNDRTGKIELEGGQTYSFQTFSQQGGNFPAQYERTTDTGNGNPRSNYALFEGLTGDSQTLNLIRGSSNSGFHGIQIIGIEDPGLASVELQSATLVRSDSARIRGRVTSIGNDEPAITFYYGSSDAGANAQDWEKSIALPGKYSDAFLAQINDLDPGTEYFFRALASNSAGPSWSNDSLSFKTTMAPPAIINLSASEVGATSATLGSQVTVTGGEDPEVIIYYGRSDGGTVPAGWELSKNFGSQADMAKFSVSDLLQNTQYFFRAFSQNSGGSSWAESTGSFLTTKILPPAVSNRTASNVSGTSANLRGTVTDSGGNDPTITFYFGPTDGESDPSSWTRSVEIGTRDGDFSFFVSGLEPLTKYYYRAFASNAIGAVWSTKTEQFETTDSNASEIVINEIHYDVPDKTVRAEFIELYNPSDSAIDLSGWRLSSAVNYTFPIGTSVQAGGFLVVAEDPQTILAEWGVNSLGPWKGSLSNGGENVRIRNLTDKIVDEVDYKAGFPWPVVGSSPGYSIELINPSLENDLGGNWRSSVGTAGGDGSTLITGESSWKLFKGVTEPSATNGAWRQINFDDSDWAEGEASIGFGEGFLNTNLADMRGNYSTVYFRKSFNIENPSQIGSLLLSAQIDDGFNAWINGKHVASTNVAGPELDHDATANSSGENKSFEDYPVANFGGLLVEGKNVLSVQLLNGSLNGSSDAFFDAILQVNTSAGEGPSPGFPNTVFSVNSAPQVRKLEHFPKQPAEGDLVTITARITDADTVSSATLQYQIVEPGNYIRLSDSLYDSKWIDVPMNDSGNAGDEFAEDNVWSVQVPGTVQKNRRLIRYRIRVSDALDNTLTVPYSDDPQPNFAYYCYNGVPDWKGALRPGSTPVITYSSETLTKVPVYHMIVKESDVLSCMYNDSSGSARSYKYYATVVYDGEVYDHIKFRLKGKGSTRVTGKNKIKWNFNRGHRFQARDNYGKKYDRKWDKFALQTGTCPWWGSNASTGGMILNEFASYKFYRLCGLASCNTTLFHLRIVDDAQESNSNDQYDGDFWGIYLALEEPDGRFLDEMGMPDGNLYKMNGGATKRNQGPDQVSSNSDVSSFISAKNRANNLSWWEENTNLSSYYNYKIGTTLINNTDLRSEWNCLYYHRPIIPGDPNSDKWEMLPWDLDLTWESKFHLRSENVWENWQNVFRYDDAETDFENRSREVWDLLCSSGEGAKVVEEMKRFLDGDGITRIVEANQAMWDYHPRKSKKGIWYRNNPKLPSSKRNWEGLVEYMKNFVSPGGYGAGRLINEKADTSSIVPNKPTISSVGDPDFSTDDIRFESSNFSGRGSSFAGMEWRLAEVTDPGSAIFDPESSWVYEIDSVWESGELASFGRRISIPPLDVRVGHTYRARVRHLSSSGQWSHWSEPLQFSAGSPDISVYKEGLIISEFMYNPLNASGAEELAGFSTSDFEFIELKNVGDRILDLSDIRFTKGIDFDFVDGTILSLLPGEYIVVVRNLNAFESRYGDMARVTGQYGPDNLSNGGENIKLSYGAGLAIHEFRYLDEDPWPQRADGEGFSLTLLRPELVPEHSLAENWAISSGIGGSPGKDETRVSFSSWKGSVFSPDELLEPSFSGNLVDPDNDGIANFLEYAFGGDPKIFDPDIGPESLILEEDGEDYLGLSFRKRLGANDLHYLIEHSTDLVSWNLATEAVLSHIVNHDDGSVTETYRISTINDSGSSQFLRVKIQSK